MKLPKLTFLIVVVLLSACHTIQYTNVTVEYTPKAYLGKDSTTILLINQVDTNLWNLSNQKKRDVLKTAAISAINYCDGALRSLPHIRVINIVDSIHFKLNSDSIKILAANYHANLVLALVKFSANINLDGIDDGTSYYSTNVVTNFLLYQPDGIYFKKLNDTVNEANAEIPYTNILASLIVHPTIKGSKNNFIIAAQHAAHMALQDYLPASFTNQRPLYTDEFLKPAVDEILSGHISRADSLLTPLIKDKNPQIAGKSAYNLSVVYESEGDIESAIDMAKKSQTLYQNNYATNILRDLVNE